jgi:hypothetical protein
MTPTIIPPATRLVVVEVYADEESDRLVTSHAIIPVVGIASRGDGVYAALIVESGRIVELGEHGQSSNSDERLFACSWSVDDDEVKLAEPIREMTRELLTRMQGDRRG